MTRCGTGSAELAELPTLLAEKIKAPSVAAGPTDLVIDPTNLWLTIHESIGHATEYDRAIGYEAAYAGTSFATPDKLNTMRYGSPVMNVTADRTVEFGLASSRLRRRGGAGAAAGIWCATASSSATSSTGCSRRGWGWRGPTAARMPTPPHHVPIQRMANVSLQPGADDLSTDDLIGRVEDGIYIVGDKSWSIDMQRYNFQFTGQRFFRIRDGRLDGQLRDVAYQATTTDFWNSMEAVGGPSTWRLGGAFNCGKAQPGQVAAVSHGCPSALFRGVNVLNTRGRRAAPMIAAQQVVDLALARPPARPTRRSSWSPTRRGLAAVGRQLDDHQRCLDQRSDHGDFHCAPRR